MADRNTTTRIQEQDIWPGLISVIIPLLQLISVVVVGLADTFHVSSLLVFPSILNLINLLTMLVTVSIIGWFWYWRNNLNWVNWKPETRTFNPDQTKVEKLIRSCVIFSSVLLVLFTVVTIIYTQSYKPELNIFWGIGQYISYSLLLVLSGLAIYIWIYEFIRKKQTFQREDFTRNLLVTLGEYNLIKRPDVKIYRNEQGQNFTRVVEVEIADKRYVLTSSIDGLEIMSSYEKTEFEQQRTLPTIVDLQAQVQALLAQIAALQSPPQDPGSQSRG